MIVGRETTTEQTLHNAKDTIAAGYPSGRRWAAAYREASIVEDGQRRFEVAGRLFGARIEIRAAAWTTWRQPFV
jgi:hypothetical protein